MRSRLDNDAGIFLPSVRRFNQVIHSRKKWRQRVVFEPPTLVRCCLSRRVASRRGEPCTRIFNTKHTQHTLLKIHLHVHASYMCARNYRVAQRKKKKQKTCRLTFVYRSQCIIYRCTRNFKRNQTFRFRVNSIQTNETSSNRVD